jgi:stress-induced-phosphoprotein 1
MRAEVKTPSDLKREEGNAAFSAKDYATAIALYTAAIELDPSKAQNYCNRGIAAKSAGQLEEALADFSMAIQVKPDYSKAYFQRAQIYFDAKEYAMALQDAKQAQLLEPKDRAIAERIKVRFP